MSFLISESCFGLTSFREAMARAQLLYLQGFGGFPSVLWAPVWCVLEQEPMGLDPGCLGGWFCLF